MKKITVFVSFFHTKKLKKQSKSFGSIEYLKKYRLLCGRRLPFGFLESEIPKDYEKIKNKSKNFFLHIFFLVLAPECQIFHDFHQISCFW